MAHLQLVPQSVDHEAEAQRLKQKILERGGVRVDREKARAILASLGADVMVTEDDGEVA